MELKLSFDIIDWFYVDKAEKLYEQKEEKSAPENYFWRNIKFFVFRQWELSHKLKANNSEQ